MNGRSEINKKFIKYYAILTLWSTLDLLQDCLYRLRRSTFSTQFS